MLAAIRCVDELLANGVARWHAVQGADPFRGLHIGPEEVERWLGAADAEPEPISAGLTSVMTRAVNAALDDSVFRWLVGEFALTAFQAAALVIAFAPELDLRYERLFAYLQDDVGKRRPTVDLLLRLLCPDRTRRALWLGEFGSGAPLVQNRLITVARNPEAPLLSAPVQLDYQIAAVLLRHGQLDSRLVGFCKVSAATRDFGGLPIAPEWHKALPALLASAREERRPLRFYLQGPSGVGKGHLADAIAARLGARLVTADLGALRQLSDIGERLRLTFREVWLKGGVLYLTGVDGLREDGAQFSALLGLISADPGVTVLSGHSTWSAAELDATGIIPLAFDVTAPGVQRASWTRALDNAGITVPEDELAVLAERFRLTPAQAGEAALAAVNRARWREAVSGGGDTRPTLEDFFLAARLQGGQELATLARRIEPKRSWSDIVLPQESFDQLREICARIASHRQVLRDWGFARRLSLGKGVTALFSGPSGTGKTLAAEIIAYELGLFLYKIDLATVVSKYIGETEKNLDRLFTAAQDANCVLFFDEADALFGKRSEVRDSHDRYANLEISYLLQKMEEFEGLAILATNLRQNLDDAFTRRLAFTVHFPFPDEHERHRIWSEIWPSELPVAPDVDALGLARELKMSGGNIKNTALAAAYYAAADGGVVTRAHLLRAARREFQKMGKVPSTLETAIIEGNS
ncbi:MAG: AAA family ATPase [Alphaproteobacteria bacterium]|nr:AAA family ATPase [Alphaproteobacteria bacterium]MBV9377923.1 AAA family ATPase [Alphaproteobacteria bacterium]